MQTAEKIYQLKITVDDTKPPVWRRILIPADATFRDLHETIQLVFDWCGYHLHDFQVKSGNTARPLSITDLSAMDVDPWWDDDAKSDERKVKLSDALQNAGDRCRYWYDFGDDWLHSIVLEKILSAVSGLEYPVCIKGKRASPLEDCGGPWGYAELCAVLANPSHLDHEDMLEWLGLNNASEFNPEEFDVDAVNELLRDGYEAYAPVLATAQ